MVKLGSKVRDAITGFSGIATGQSEFLYGCKRVMIEPQEMKDGKPIEAQWFDEQRVELVEEQEKPQSSHSTAKVGGPQNDPPRSSGKANG